MTEDIRVEPDLLRGAAREFYAGADAAADGAVLLDCLRLDPALLGEVDGAGEFAAALARFGAAHGEDLRQGSAWFADAAQALNSNADGYAEGETEARRLLGGSR
ncbi:hypothetical protein N8J89_40225 [Crossiella sp. CA-258035]|uniref:hypothetical protein n=1 Tax=Crossiella sp. CA-258035 TaxID=2981138 RepID=UPI0024BD4065|nr:hypothetical protein [Crossiella sp. CA-258035]WHT19246.1 hypothetical protein N8J89_40225 [Crossiella sp. CA-258035]